MLLATSLSFLVAVAGTPSALPSPALAKSPEFIVSVQAWTFNRYSAIQAVRLASQAGAKAMEFFPGQEVGAEIPGVRLGPDMSDEQTAKFKAILDANGVRAVAYGVTGIDKDEAKARKLFRWAKSLGIGIINTESVDALDTMEKMVKEFDMKVGFHNHPKNSDPNYKVWDPNYVLSIVKNRDKRIGSCADTGHWVRSGIKPVDALKILRGRVVSSHLKDLNVFAPGGHDVPYGTGVSDVVAILSEYTNVGMNGSVSVEYEHDTPNLQVEVGQCLGFMNAFVKLHSK
ncbi:MAG: sugar phosphate isomerase/epimerase family protein [Fimbriimonas sp.]